MHARPDIESYARRVALRFRDDETRWIAQIFVRFEKFDDFLGTEKDARTSRPTLLEQMYDDGAFDGGVEAAETIFEAMLRSRFPDDPTTERAARHLGRLAPADAVAAIESAGDLEELLRLPIPERTPVHRTSDQRSHFVIGRP
ncbi:hypothetical protein [Fodinicola feengrottensis]|uniref:hypothetical protein n=1 Tax=Fodinicola feengrottensis TaxID=435914 RepID=UPI0013D62F9B|nr:hypothetical protein [Fodinicola feengrottensis]